MSLQSEPERHGVDAAPGHADSSGASFDAELKARLAEIEAPGYSDPARANLTGLDWLSIVAFIAVVSVGFVVWGY